MLMGNGLRESNQENKDISDSLGRFLGLFDVMKALKGFIEAIIILTMWSVLLNYSRRGFEVIALYLITKMGSEFMKFRKDLERMDDTLLKMEFPELFKKG